MLSRRYRHMNCSHSARRPETRGALPISVLDRCQIWHRSLAPLALVALKGPDSVLDVSALRTFQPLIATPCHGNSVFLNYVLSAIRFQEAYFFSVGKRLDFFFRHG